MPSALMVYGGWDGHEPKQCVDVFAPILQSHGFDVHLSDTLDAYLDTERLRSLDLIVPVWTMGTITKEQEAGLLAAVQGGVNIAGWHGGMADSFQRVPWRSLKPNSSGPNPIEKTRTRTPFQRATRKWPSSWKNTTTVSTNRKGMR